MITCISERLCDVIKSEVDFELAVFFCQIKCHLLCWVENATALNCTCIVYVGKGLHLGIPRHISAHSLNTLSCRVCITKEPPPLLHVKKKTSRKYRNQSRCSFRYVAVMVYADMHNSARRKGILSPHDTLGCCRHFTENTWRLALFLSHG